MKKVLVLSVVMIMTAGVLCVFAAEGQTAAGKAGGVNAPGREKANQPPDVSGLQRRGQARQGQGPVMVGEPNMMRGQRNPEQMGGMMEQMAKERNARNEQILAELEEIKKIAQSEKADKTVEAIGKLIDKKKAEFAKQADEVEKNRQEIMNRIRQSREQRIGQPPLPPVAPGQGVAPAPLPGQGRGPGSERTRQPRPESQPRQLRPESQPQP